MGRFVAGRGWGWRGRVVLHKLSSHSACIAWPTVLKAERNVGQTPPPPVCILVFCHKQQHGFLENMSGVASNSLLCLFKSFNSNMAK